MTEQTMKEGREKHWGELNDKEKLERLARWLHSTTLELMRAESKLLRMEEHYHLGNKIVVPMNKKTDVCNDIYVYNQLRSHRPVETPQIEVTCEPLRDTEKRAIALAMQQNDGNRSITAKQLRIGERTLYRKLKQYKL